MTIFNTMAKILWYVSSAPHSRQLRSCKVQSNLCVISCTVVWHIYRVFMLMLCMNSVALRALRFRSTTLCPAKSLCYGNKRRLCDIAAPEFKLLPVGQEGTAFINFQEVKNVKLLVIHYWCTIGQINLVCMISPMSDLHCLARSLQHLCPRPT